MGWQIPEAKCISSLDCFEHFKPWWSKHSYLELDIKMEPARGILVYRLYLLELDIKTEPTRGILVYRLYLLPVPPALKTSRRASSSELGLRLVASIGHGPIESSL